jgi:hypothetical protein
MRLRKKGAEGLNNDQLRKAVKNIAAAPLLRRESSATAALR